MKVQTGILLGITLCLVPTHARNPKKKTHLAQTPQEFEKIIYEWSGTFAQVLQLANQKHYKISDAEQAMIKAIDAFLTNLDAHSKLLDPETYKSMMESTSGQFPGIGVFIDNTRKPKDKHLTIIEPIPDGPAEKAGIKPLDKIVEVDGEPLEGLATEEIIRKLKGPKHTKVHVKVVRENHPDMLSIDIERDLVKEQVSMSFYIKDHDIYYIALTMFTESAFKQIEKLLNNAQKKPYKGLILDLRNNSGGLLNSVIDIAGLFVEKNSLVVTTKDKNNVEKARYVTAKKPITNNNLPIFILINNYTASAAEILAGVLKIHAENGAKKTDSKNKPLVFLVGTPSFGKGSVQEVIPICNDCAAKITTALYYLPNDKTIQGEGIAPDFFVERNLPPTEQTVWFTNTYGRESNLEHSIKTPEQIAKEKTEDKKSKKKKEEDTKHKRWAERAKKILKTDNQVREAIYLINSLSTAQELCPDCVDDRSKALTYLTKRHINTETLNIEEIKG